MSEMTPMEIQPNDPNPDKAQSTGNKSMRTLRSFATHVQKFLRRKKPKSENQITAKRWAFNGIGIEPIARFSSKVMKTRMTDLPVLGSQPSKSQSARKFDSLDLDLPHQAGSEGTPIPQADSGTFSAGQVIPSFSPASESPSFQTPLFTQSKPAPTSTWKKPDANARRFTRIEEVKRDSKPDFSTAEPKPSLPSQASQSEPIVQRKTEAPAKAESTRVLPSAPKVTNVSKEPTPREPLPPIQSRVHSLTQQTPPAVDVIQRKPAPEPTARPEVRKPSETSSEGKDKPALSAQKINRETSEPVELRPKNISSQTPQQSEKPFLSAKEILRIKRTPQNTWPTSSNLLKPKKQSDEPSLSAKVDQPLADKPKPQPTKMRVSRIQPSVLQPLVQRARKTAAAHPSRAKSFTAALPKPIQRRIANRQAASQSQAPATPKSEPTLPLPAQLQPKAFEPGEARLTSQPLTPSPVHQEKPELVNPSFDRTTLVRQPEEARVLKQTTSQVQRDAAVLRQSDIPQEPLSPQPLPLANIPPAPQRQPSDISSPTPEKPQFSRSAPQISRQVKDQDKVLDRQEKPERLPAATPPRASQPPTELPSVSQPRPVLQIPQKHDQPQKTSSNQPIDADVESPTKQDLPLAKAVSSTPPLIQRAVDSREKDITPAKIPARQANPTDSDPTFPAAEPLPPPAQPPLGNRISQQVKLTRPLPPTPARRPAMQPSSSQQKEENTYRPLPPAEMPLSRAPGENVKSGFQPPAQDQTSQPSVFQSSQPAFRPEPTQPQHSAAIQQSEAEDQQDASSSAQRHGSQAAELSEPMPIEQLPSQQPSGAGEGASQSESAQQPEIDLYELALQVYPEVRRLLKIEQEKLGGRSF